jgi:hypothetical protein
VDVKPVIERTDFDLFADTPKVSNLQQEFNNFEMLAGSNTNDENFWMRFEQVTNLLIFSSHLAILEPSDFESIGENLPLHSGVGCVKQKSTFGFQTQHLYE